MLRLSLPLLSNMQFKFLWNIARAADTSPVLSKFFINRTAYDHLSAISDSVQQSRSLLPNNSNATEHKSSSFPNIPFNPFAIPSRPIKDLSSENPVPSDRPLYAYYVSRFPNHTSRLYPGDIVLLAVAIGYDVITALATIDYYSPVASRTHYLAFARIKSPAYPSVFSPTRPNQIPLRRYFRDTPTPRYLRRHVPIFIPFNPHDVDDYYPHDEDYRAWSRPSMNQVSDDIHAVAHLSSSSFFQTEFRSSLIDDLDQVGDFQLPTLYPTPLFGRANSAMHAEAEALPYDNVLIPYIGIA